MPHSLRRTFASLLFAIGEPPPYVMAQMGHSTASLTLSIDARQMDRRDDDPERLRALVNGEEWAQKPTGGAAAGGHTIGTRERATVEAGPRVIPPEPRKLGHIAGVAQLAERLSCKQGVSGSSPLSGFREKTCKLALFVLISPPVSRCNRLVGSTHG